jgi:hypothetical protein
MYAYLGHVHLVHEDHACDGGAQTHLAFICNMYIELVI